MINAIKVSAPIPQRVSLPEELAGIILRLIQDGDFRPGDVLPSEQTLATSFNVSRTVVREALARLKFEGIIQSKRGSGPVVTMLPTEKKFILPEISTVEDRVKIIEFRIIMEGEAAALAAVRRSEEQVNELQMYLNQMEDAVLSRRSGADPDYRFHCLIATATGNSYVSNFTKFLSAKMFSLVQGARSLSNQDLEIAKQVLDEHCCIFAAILNQSPDEARTAAHSHMVNSANRQKLPLAGPFRYRCVVGT